MNSAEKRRLREFITALRTPCQVELSAESRLNSSEFETEFRSKLLAHHCFIGSVLFGESFDAAFVAACLQGGHEVKKAPRGQRFWDVIVDGRRISLKSSKAKNMRKESLHISKLTEAAWIQDCRSATKRRERTFELFEKYCGEVDAILQLRYFSPSNLYELVEIPVTPLFQQIFNLDRIQFSADGPTINIPVGKVPPDFTLKLDRSDAKVTIANIDKNVCFVHGTWQLQPPQSKTLAGRV